MKMSKIFCWQINTLKFIYLNLFQPSVAFYIETSHLFCRAKQMTGFYIIVNTRVKWINKFLKTLNQ